MKTKTLPWHRPACSFCGDPIDKIDDALAEWNVDDENKFILPGVVHRFEDRNLCSFRARRVNASINDRLVTLYRRMPMLAAMDALGARLDTEEMQDAWSAWLCVVLGLPFPPPGADVFHFAGNSEAVSSEVPQLALYNTRYAAR